MTGADSITVAASAAAIARAARLIQAGKLVAFPTETVYGLGGNAQDDTAIAAIYEVKGRPTFNPLIVHVADADVAGRIGEFNDQALELARRFWPGPLTLVLPRTPEARISLLLSAGLETIAVRVPAHPVARDLLRAAGLPIAAPSANPSGAISPTNAAHVTRHLGAQVAMVIDGGACPVGLESTVIEVIGGDARLLRPGAIAREDIEAVIGPLAANAGDKIKSPGMVGRHYAPSAPLRLDATGAGDGELLLGFGALAPPGAMNLSASGDLVEAAANLFAMLHELDGAGPAAIAVMAIPERGLGLAINDRLRRAAA